MRRINECAELFKTFLLLNGREQWGCFCKRVEVKRSVFSRRGKCMIVCRSVHDNNPVDNILFGWGG